MKLDLIADKKYLLTLQRTGKSKGQTIVNDKGDILKDQLLHIKSIEIDEIDLGALVFEGLYTPVYPEPWHSQQVKNNTAPPKSIKNSIRNELYLYDINGNSYECYRCNFNRRSNAYLVGRSYNAFCWFYYSLAL